MVAIRRIVLAAVFVAIVLAILDRVRIIIIGGLFDLVVLFGVLAIAFLLIEHYLNHGKP